MAGKFAHGKHSKAMCPVGGHKVRYKDLRLRWDGLWVSKDEIEPKHEQLEPTRYTEDPQGLEHAWPDRDNDDPDGNIATRLNSLTNPTFGETV